MKRWLFPGILILLMSCGQDKSPLKSNESTTGSIRIVIQQSLKAEKSVSDSTPGDRKTAKSALVNSLEIRVLKSDNSLLVTKTDTPKSGRFEGIIDVEAQNDLKVLCIGKNNNVIERFGVDDDVDVKPGKTTPAEITGWYDPYIPYIDTITLNPDTNGVYTVTWNEVPAATTYILQEADNPVFTDARTVYTGTDHRKQLSGKNAGSYCYRVSASNEYGVISGWSAPSTVKVVYSYTISGTVTGADSITVTLGGDKTESRTVNNGGTYSFTVEHGGSFTVTPAKTGYDFNPSVKTFTDITTNQTQDFTGSKVTYALSGTITGADGVTVKLSGDTSGSQMVNSGGTYLFTVEYGGTYTVTPSRDDYDFLPESKSFTNVTANQTQNFTATKHIQQYTLTLAVNQSGWGTTSPLMGAHTYDEGTVVTVTATPASGYRFVSWTGSVTDASSTTTTATMNSNMTVTVNFEKITITIAFVTIPGGTFQMGNSENFSGGKDDEKPVHTVTVSSYEMSIYEITNAQYAVYLNEALASGDITATSSSVTGKTGSYSGTEYISLSGSYDSNNKCWITFSNETFNVASGKENWPVVFVTWYGSKAYALYYGLDLPTEAEWEYACRGGRQYMYGTDDGTLSTSKADYWDTGINHPSEAGSYPKNPFGLYDMSGNVWEWCNDWYGAYTADNENNPTGVETGSSRVVRGGSWGSDSASCRSACRSYSYPDHMANNIGFRVVRRTSNNGTITIDIPWPE